MVKKSDTWFFWVMLLMVVSAFAATGYKFFIAKNYSFDLEASCDPSVSKCFHRDCTNPDDCPPNGLSDYREFTINANDFAKCSDNSCLKECTNSTIKCEETICGDAEGDECAETTATTTAESPDTINLDMEAPSLSATSSTTK